MPLVTSESARRTDSPARPRSFEWTPHLARLRRIARMPAAWYAGFAVYAACVALFSGPGLDRWWGTWAVGGYALAAVVAARAPARAGQIAALGIATMGALVAPLAWLATQAPLTSDAAVVMRSGTLLLRHGTPYLGPAQLAHGGWLAYDPYLPVMALFGLPKALGLPGLLGDERPWLVVATFLLLFSAFRAGAARIAAGRRAPARSPLGLAAFAMASPALAFPLAMGITDPPVIAMICLALALLIRRPHARSRSSATHSAIAPGTGARAVLPAAVVLGLACAMKYTAWPALAMIAVMVIARDGRRAAVAFIATALGTALASSAALAPAALGSLSGLGAVARNTIAYPLGLTAASSPAQSPLPGHFLVAAFGPAGHAAAIALLALTGIVFAVSLVTTPPTTQGGAAIRIALGLAAMFALCPATRFGYLTYPLALLAWAALTARPGAARRATARYAASVAWESWRSRPEPSAGPMRT